MNTLLHLTIRANSKTHYSNLCNYWLLLTLALAQLSVANIQEIPINPNQELKVNYFNGNLIIEGNRTNNNSLTIDNPIKTDSSINNRSLNTQKNSFTIKIHNYKHQIVLTIKPLIKKFRSINIHSSQIPSLRIRTPTNIPIKIDHGQGDLTLNNISAPLYINDEDGNIQISNAQFIKIKDTDGNITLNTIGKPHNSNNQELVRIEDGSGTINIQQIYGNISIDDGSGSIKANNVFGRLFINDGSGDIHTNYIHNGLIIEDGSGDIVIENTRKYSIKEDSSGIVQIH